MADLAALYWERHASRQKSARDVRRHLDIYIIPLLGRKFVAEVRLADVQMVFDHVARRAKIQANRTLATLSKMFSLAERWQLRPLNSNVCKLVQRSKERARRRYLRGDEAPRLAAALDAEAITHPVAVAALHFLLHSGMRRGEVLSAMWRHIDGRVLRLPDSKNGDQRDVHLSAALGQRDTVLAWLRDIPSRAATRRLSTSKIVRIPPTPWVAIPS
jgi:integrase